MLPYQDKYLPIKIRVNDLLQRMTLKEKVGQINQHLYGWKIYSFNKQTKEIEIKKDFIDHIKWGGGIGALYGVFRADPWSQVNYENGVLPSDAWKVANKIQKSVIENSRLHIPALLVEECPHGHQALDSIYQVNKNIISILIQGRPYDIREVVAKSKAVLIGWYPGQEGGKAVVNILSGDTVPSGVLSISYPRNSQQLPVYYYQRKNSKQDNYVDELGKPLYPFGYRLTYSNLKFKDLTISNHDTYIKIKIKIENNSSYLGKTPILIFATLFGGNVLPRYKLLVEFTRVVLQPRRSKLLEFNIPKKRLTLYDYKMHKIKAEQARIQIENLSQIISL